MSTPYLAAGAAVALGLLVVLARRRWLVVQVHGSSMEPALRHGQRLLAHRRSGRQPRRGSVVVVDGEGLDGTPLLLIKRVTAVSGDPVPAAVCPAVGQAPGTSVPSGAIVLLGDNPAESIDSREWGFVRVGAVRATVVRAMYTRAPDPELVLDHALREDELASQDVNARIVIRPRVDSDG